jgi:hypothetical protein
MGERIGGGKTLAPDVSVDVWDLIELIVNVLNQSIGGPSDQ